MLPAEANLDGYIGPERRSGLDSICSFGGDVQVKYLDLQIQ